MLVLLGAAATAVVYIRLRDHEQRTSVEIARQNERMDLAREVHARILIASTLGRASATIPTAVG